MDPNLTRIINSNLYHIERNRLAVPILQSKDYLSRILGWNTDQIDKEMDEIVEYMKGLVKYKSNNRKKNDNKFERYRKDR